MSPGHFVRLWWRLDLRYRLHTLREQLEWGLAWALPRRIAYLCAVRVGAHATTRQWGDVVPDQVTVVEALKRWDVPHESPERLQ